MSEHTPTPKLVLGHILQFSLNDNVGGVPSDEAFIHFEGDEDSEINLRCPGALRLASLIVTAVNSHADLVEALEAALPHLDNSDSPGGCDGSQIGCNHCRAVRLARAALAKVSACPKK